MKSVLDSLIAHLHSIEFLLPSLAGGLVDYLTTLKRDPGGCSIVGMATHMFSAGFFGWSVGELAMAMGRADGEYAVACGIGGLMGTRLAEIALFVIRRKAGMDAQS